MRHVSRIEWGALLGGHHDGHGHRWRAWAPLVGLSVAVLTIGLSGGGRTARELPMAGPPASAFQRIDVEVAPNRGQVWTVGSVADIEPEEASEVPAQVSPGGQILRLMGPPLVIEVRLPRSKNQNQR